MTKDTSKKPDATMARTAVAQRRSLKMFESAPGGGSWNVSLSKAVAESQARSNQQENTGKVAHPFDWAAAKRFKNADPHHSSCMEAKINATVGLGFKSDKVPSNLDDLCQFTFQDLVTAVDEDFWTVGNGFIEVVRDEAGEIEGLFHLAAEDVHVVIEDGKTLNFHYHIRQATGSDGVGAAWGDREDLLKRKPMAPGVNGVRVTEKEDISEVIHVRRPSALNRWYGMPDWLSAVSNIELAQCILQYNYDFFLNNGVPEFLFLLAGAHLGDTWDKEIVPALKGASGMGNGHSTVAISVVEEVKMQVERIGVEMADGWFQNMLDTVAVRIVTAHRVPPIIAGVMLPGKIGAANEHVNAMWLFQGLVIAPAQKIHASCLGKTLGGSDGIKGLSGEKAFELKTLTEEIPTAQVEVAGTPNEPNKTVGGRKDIKGTAQGKTPQERQAASLKKFEDSIAFARESLGDEIVDDIVARTFAALHKAVEEA